MPKVSTSTRRSSRQDGKKRSKHRDHQYRDAAKVRKIRKCRFNGIEVIEPVESGKPRSLKRTPKVDMARFGRKMHANYEESRPLNAPIIPAEVYAADVNLNVPRIIIPTSEVTAKWKQAAATDDGDNDNDNTDVDESEDIIMVPVGFVEVAEMLGLLRLNAPASPLETLELGPEPGNPPVERRSTRIKTPLNSPLLASLNKSSALPARTTHSAPSTQSSYMVPEPMLVDDNQSAATTPPELSMPHLYLGSTDDDVDMESEDEATMEPPDYSIPMMWTSFQPQSEHILYSQVGQVADNTTHNTPVNWASIMPMQNKSINHMNQPQFNHSVDPLAAASCFWETLSRIPGTSQSPTTVPEITKSTPTQSDEQRPNKEPSEPTLPPISQESQPDNAIHPFPQLRGCKNMKFITMSRESEESRIIPGHRRWEKPPVGSEMDLVAHLKTVELEGRAAQQVERRKQRREDFQPEFARTSNPDFEAQAQVRPRRRSEPEVSKLKNPIPVPKRRHKRQDHQQRQRSASESSQTPTEWNFSRFLPSITSLVDRFYKFF